MPLTSIQCWHVHCEECWLRTLVRGVLGGRGLAVGGAAQMFMVMFEPAWDGIGQGAPEREESQKPGSRLPPYPISLQSCLSRLQVY